MLVNNSMDMRQEIVDAARKYADVPWVHQGRNKYGIDCVGLLVLVARDVGLKPLDVTTYSQFYNSSILIKAFIENGCKKITKTTAQSGDIMAINIGRCPMHVGILSEKRGIKHIIHAFRPSRFVREEEIYPLMWKRFAFGFKFPGL